MHVPRASIMYDFIKKSVRSSERVSQDVNEELTRLDRNRNQCTYIDTMTSMK